LPRPMTATCSFSIATLTVLRLPDCPVRLAGQAPVLEATP
jgi:hypothetical protein